MFFLSSSGPDGVWTRRGLQVNVPKTLSLTIKWGSFSGPDRPTGLISVSRRARDATAHQDAVVQEAPLELF
jgi:hypothetical protein